MHSNEHEAHYVRPLVLTEIACFGGTGDSYVFSIDLCAGCVVTLLVTRAVLHSVGMFDSWVKNWETCVRKTSCTNCRLSPHPSNLHGGNERISKEVSQEASQSVFGRTYVAGRSAYEADVFPDD